jgi:hypothetical protein
MRHGGNTYFRFSKKVLVTPVHRLGQQKRRSLSRIAVSARRCLSERTAVLQDLR